MPQLHLKIITPAKIVKEDTIYSATIPTSAGEITILPRHTHLFSQIAEGVITFRKEGGEEDYLAIGAGYVETDGKELRVLVSRAYGQDEIDEKITQKALEDAQKLSQDAKDANQRREATALMRRSMIDLKLLRKRKRV